ncbi:MAG: phosphatidylglycerophosphatase A [Syntrophobacter sp.]
MPKYLSHTSMATLFGIGNAPFAPGTVATLAAGVPVFIAVGHLSWMAQTLVASLILVAGCVVSGNAERELGKADPSEVVIDELCGFLVGMIGHPVTLASILAGFAFFRLFDIWKPWPVGLLDKRLHGGLGIMLDDVAAGIYANIAGIIVLRLAGLW